MQAKQDIAQVQFERHKDFAVRVEQFGNESQTVVVIDNFLADAEQLVDYIAERPDFGEQDSLYPGVRAAAPKSYLMALYTYLPPILERVFGVDSQAITGVESAYSLVTTPPDQLRIPQRIPHFDSTVPTEFAMIHFLCGAEHGGTSVYRHRDTGFEHVDDARYPAYMASLEAAIREGREPPPAYINGDTELFERTGSFDAAFNRLLLYRCPILHSGNIAEDFNFDPNPRTGRLSLNTFLLNG
ncbi:DUF6445 family protein [Marinimicrobium sp. ABcell2]|uniref:DUF6445 family protein n=1 Tax=Marinimicrobium sp. ABcell2 TaxID=3069751 RepID=UPI0027B3697F|nr:DUF6445 family protein [Marinimicrobium sp. ABcell2]MDQ2075753.1 DUF6445 family protein [Marinimicrobium sp. ABcell2]